jgi:ATP-dependent Zn protease
MNHISEYSVISSLQTHFKTNNMIYDMIFGLIVAKIIQSLFNYSLSDIKNLTKKMWNLDFMNKGKVVITCAPTNPDNRFRVLQALDYIIKNNKIKPLHINYDNNGKDFIIRYMDKTNVNNINVSISSEDIDKKKDEAVVTRITIYTITLTSRYYKSTEIETKINEWINEWEQSVSQKNIQITRDEESAKDFKSFKTFDNLFFDGKDILIKSLDRFKNNEALYKKLGRPYTIGILLYGEPGCGKTSVLKAISNYLNLDIHTINIKNYDDINDFMGCWYMSLKTNSYKQDSLKEKIIHLPEIDYLCEEFLKDEESKKTKEVENNEKNIVINLNKNDENDTKDKKKTLNKAFFRELFDGVDEQHGRIIVMDTNNPERLDPIMIRDGRFDIKLKFDKMSSNNMKLYLEHVYDIKLPDNIELPDRKFRVAKIQSIIESCINNELSIEECIKQIIETQQEEI